MPSPGFALACVSRVRALVLGAALIAGACDPTSPVAVGADEGGPAAGHSTPAPATPVPAAPTPSPFAGARLFVEPGTNAQRTADGWRARRPADAELMDRIARQPQAIWLGDWNPDVRRDADRFMDAAEAAGGLPVFVAYNIPQRDCGLYSAGGARDASAYRAWIRALADGIGPRRAIVLLEPDAVANLDCMSPGDREARVALLRDAVQALEAKPGIAVYIDAGNAFWHSPEEIAARLQSVGIAQAEGFALNISNFVGDADNVRYGERVSRLLGGKHFVVDTSRNGQGPAAGAEWCNPAGRGLGIAPTLQAGHALVDALLWVKTPGESDGECNGGPGAGVWWPEYALGLAQRATSARSL